MESAVELLMEANVEAYVNNSSDGSWPGEIIATALYILNCCPIHSRYQRRGLGLHKPLQQSVFLVTYEEVTVSGLFIVLYTAISKIKRTIWTSSKPFLLIIYRSVS